MSWLYSRALVEAFSGGGCSDGAPSAPSSGNPTPQAYLPPDRTTAFSSPSRFGMTFAPLTDDHGAAVLTSFLAAFPAKTSASQAKAPALTESAAACGPTWRASLARFDPATSSWKTAQRSLLGDLDESSVIWPRSGMTAGGQCWELPMLVPRINATGFGLWATPSATDGQGGGTITPNMTGVSLAQMINTPTRWPTPTTQDNVQIRGIGKAASKSKRGTTLAGAVSMWPTPMAADSRGSSGRPAPGKQVQLVDAVKFATPLSRDYRSGKASQATHDKNSRPLSEQVGGSLNPTWVEWLMGWPLGWTALEPLETAKFQQWRRSHGRH